MKLHVGKNIFLIIILVIRINLVKGSQYDTISILKNIDLQIESTSSINKMYNYKFKDSEKEFIWLAQEYNNHPLPSFLSGLSLWWQIDAQSGKINGSPKDLDDKFLLNMDKTIDKANEIYKKGNIVDGAFFLAASYAFKGRLLADRKKWTQSALAGRNAIKYLKEIKKNDLMIPEIDFGNGLFNYYSIWISDRYPLLRPLVNFFPKGDKKKGIEELTNASGNSFYTRTEAQFFLMRIYLGERNLINALQLSKYLNETYPDNSIFHKYYTQILYQNGKLKQSYMSANNILKKFNSNSFGYNHDEARISHFFIGEYYHSKLNFEKAIYNYLKAIEYANLLGKEKMGYSYYSYYYLGKIFFDRGEFKKSKIYYKKVIQLTRRKDDLNSKARLNIKKMK
tara:strand:- start:324 stop:1508 length:1185 start_codon:yes stop_codon:yes gene_type:complete